MQGSCTPTCKLTMKAKGQYTTKCHNTRNKHIDVKLTLSVNEPMIKEGVMMANISCSGQADDR